MKRPLNPFHSSAPVATLALVLSTVLMPIQIAHAQERTGISEKEFLDDMPVVLSVSRLSQRLDETPGSVTVIDREMIRQSGARDIADLLRLVPGFQVSNAFESGAPVTTYHGAYNIYAGRIELLIDGRSAYSPYFVGNIAPALLSVSMADIERIEVLRGSNSAAYGARAILGVVNIVTRHSVDTLGTAAGFHAGQNGIGDVGARLGWGSDGGSYRLSAEQRSDDGLAGANNKNTIKRLSFRSDINLPAGDTLQLQTGGYAIEAGKGTLGDKADPPRDGRFRSEFAQVDWRHHLDADQDVLVRLSHTQERYDDEFAYSLQAFGIKDSINIGFGGSSRADTLTLQHSGRQSNGLRWVWGAELRNEGITSRALFNRDDAVLTRFRRLFGNLEWRAAPALLVNAGAMYEHNSVGDETLAPRLMLNWSVAPGQTLRAGISRAYRPPSSFEQFGDVRYFYKGHLLSVNTMSSGRVRDERLTAREISYLGEFPKWAMSLDVRAFSERMDEFVTPVAGARPRYYANGEGFDIQGVEYQLKWQAWAGAQLLFNQTYTRIGPVPEYTTPDLAAPRLATTLALFQKLPGEVDLSLMHHHQGITRLIGSGWDRQPVVRRTDMRLAKRMHWGAHRGELALVVQNLGSAYRDYDPAFLFRRQAWLSLTFER